MSTVLCNKTVSVAVHSICMWGVFLSLLEKNPSVPLYSEYNCQQKGLFL
jgi:hypothetical protein